MAGVSTGHGYALDMDWDVNVCSSCGQPYGSKAGTARKARRHAGGARLDVDRKRVSVCKNIDCQAVAVLGTT